jgi:hypothetical protein
MDATLDSHFIWTVGTHTARHQNARLPYPITLRGASRRTSMKYAGYPFHEIPAFLPVISK